MKCIKDDYDTASVGYFVILNDINDLESKFHVYVSNKGTEPHFHICDEKTGGKEFHTCLWLTKIEYFYQNGNVDILSTVQKESLLKFLKSPCSKNRRYKTNWEYALSMWNDNNENLPQVDEDLDVLDYTLL